MIAKHGLPFNIAVGGVHQQLLFLYTIDGPLFDEWGRDLVWDGCVWVGYGYLFDWIGEHSLEGFDVFHDLGHVLLFILGEVVAILAHEGA
jgi:hypothetical protein